MTASISAAPDKGRDPLSSAGMLRLAIENVQRRWFCSGADCDAFDHGRDEGLKLALDAFDTERQRQMGNIEIMVVEPSAAPDKDEVELTPATTDEVERVARTVEAEIEKMDRDGETIAMFAHRVATAAIAAMSLSPVNGEVERLLAKVLAYYEGRKPFDFYRLPTEQRANESFDAWQGIVNEIRATLASPTHTNGEER